MATKLYNSHLNDIILNCNEHYILDTYIALVHISSEVKGKYLVLTYSDSKADLINILIKYVKATYKTIYNCIKRLMDRNILTFDKPLNSWILNNMENMTSKKHYDIDSNLATKNYTGYTHIRKFFFSLEFSKMKAREKRLLIYMTQLADSKASEFHKDFNMNLLKPSSSWLKVLRTKSKYYAKYTIENLLNMYKDLFIDNSENKREKDLAPNKNKRFKFFFSCYAIKNKPNDKDIMEMVKEQNIKEYKLIMSKIEFADITLSKQKIMHLIRAISNLKEWFLKERAVQLIVNKYIAIQKHKSREDIKSLPAYALVVVKSVIEEFTKFKYAMSINKINSYELGEYFIEEAFNDKQDTIDFKMDSILSLL